VVEFDGYIDDEIRAICDREADAYPMIRMLFSEYHIYKDEINLSLIESGIQRRDLGLRSSRFLFQLFSSFGSSTPGKKGS
jgi:hypothetical protein